MRLVTLVAVASTLLLGLSSAARGEGRIDQAAIGPTHGIVQVKAADATQTFVPSSAFLEGVSLGLYPLNSGGATVTIAIREGSRTGPILGAVSKFVPEYEMETTYLEHFPLPVPISVSPGETYVIEVDADAAGPGWAYTASDVYPQGSGVVFTRPLTNSDLIFETCGDGQGKPCKERAHPIEKIRHGHGGQDCVDFDSQQDCDPF